MMKILVMDEEFPYPLDSGKRIRSFNLIRRLALHHSVSYLAYDSGHSDGFGQCLDSGIHPIAVKRSAPKKSGPAFYMRLATGIFSRQPYFVHTHHSSIFERVLEATLKEQNPDLVIAEWTPYAVFFDAVRDAKKVIVAHNIETAIWQRYYENERNPLKKWYIGLQKDRIARFERNAFRSADGATAVSKLDAGVIRSFNSSLKLEVVDNGVDLRHSASVPISRDRGASLVFVGSMDWRPNQDAAIYFTREIYPLLREKNHDLKVAFVGRNPSKEVRRLGKLPGVTITGMVDDVRTHIHEASVYIVPLRVGGGSRLKILEAMALQIPIVSTTIGAEGLEVTNNENILLADTPREFVTEIERLRHDPELRHRLVAAGRRLVEQRYNWDYLAEKLEHFLHGLVEQP